MNSAALLVFSLLAVNAHAQQPPAGMALCVSCHGARGEGNAAMASPRLASQSQEYLLRQLNAYTDGSRPSAVMTPIAKGLDANARKQAAAYYAAVSAPASMAPPSDADTERGRSLATLGDGERRIQACASCHGPDGSGVLPVFPYLAGQQSAYLMGSLKTWKDGTRKTDPSGQMNAIASRLTDGDMQALARYFAARTPPGPVTPRPVAGTRRPAGPTGAPRSVEQQGVGSEQGAGTTGGGQGPGGGGGTKTAP